MVHHPHSPLHFASAEGYHKYLAHIHITGLSKGHLHPVYIAGKKHIVCHHCGSMHHKSHEHKLHHPIKTDHNPNHVFSKSSAYGGKNDLYKNVLNKKHIGIKVPKIRV